jgi:hypothetical protein
MQIVPLEAAHLFDLNAAILGWLLAAVQPKSSFRGTIIHYNIPVCKKSCTYYSGF